MRDREFEYAASVALTPQEADLMRETAAYFGLTPNDFLDKCLHSGIAHAEELMEAQIAAEADTPSKAGQGQVPPSDTVADHPLGKKPTYHLDDDIPF